MTNKEKLQAHNAELQELIGVAEALPDAKGEIKLQSKNVLPTKEIQRVKAEAGYDGLSEVFVGAISDVYIIPSGSVTITENGEYDVKNLETAVVNVEGSGGGEETIAALLDGTLTILSNNKVVALRDNALYANTKIEEIDFPALTAIGNYGLQYCYKLKAANLPNVKTMGNGAMQQNNIESLNLPLLESAGTQCFASMTKMTGFYAPKMQSVSTQAFSQCEMLEKLDFASVQNINSYAFISCAKLDTLILRSDSVVELAATNAFRGTPIASGTGYIYVPASLVDSYKAATNWSTSAAQIRAIEDYPDITGG